MEQKEFWRPFVENEAYQRRVREAMLENVNRGMSNRIYEAAYREGDRVFLMLYQKEV